MTRSCPKPPARRLALETLDRRDLPAGGPATPWGITLNSFGVLRIKGAQADDVATVAIENGQVHAVLKHRTEPTPTIPDGILVDDQDKLFPLAKVKSISFYGLDGDDSFTNDMWLTSTAFGYAGDDVLVGGSAADVLVGGDGGDTLEGRHGSDDLRGGAGNDTYVFAPVIRAGFSLPLGADTVVEAANADADRLDFSALAGGVAVNLGTTFPQSVKSGYLGLTLSDALGVENVYGTPGADTIRGNGRPNEVFAYGGNDVVRGYGGADALYGGSGKDDLRGGAANDTLYGHEDPDQLYGDDGNDVLDAGDGGDWVVGSAGNDKLYGGDGADSMTGGAGNDLLTGGGGADDLAGGANDDHLWGGAGDDTMRGGDANDVLFGGDNADDLYGGGGADDLHGEAGNDGLFGGAGADVLTCGAGADRVLQWGTDQFSDLAGEDALIHFVDGPAGTVDGVFWSGRAWTEAEIATVDGALSVLHRRTGDTTLLKHSKGYSMIFQRLGTPNKAKANSILGWNTDHGFIIIVDNAFDSGTNWVRRTVWHETGHNWDDENPNWSAFRQFSGWKSSAELLFDDPGLYTQDPDRTDPWWHFLKTEWDNFARPYGRTNPYEDYATSFESYFEEYSGMGSAEADKIPEKILFIDQFLSGL